MNSTRLSLACAVLAALGVACGPNANLGDGGTADGGAITDAGLLPDGGRATVPTISMVSPGNASTGVAINGTVSATFSEPMNPGTLTTISFRVTTGTPAVTVAGSVSYARNRAVFSPAAHFAANTLFTASIDTSVRSANEIPLQAARTWTFTTGSVVIPEMAVDLLTANNFVVLAKSGIDCVPTCAITGDIGVSPAAATAITGFSLNVDATTQFATSSQVTGRVFAATYAVPTPSTLNVAISDMEHAFTDAAGRAPNVTELGAGNIGGLTLTSGVYKWGTGLLIPTNLTLTGSATDVWVFQIDQTLSMGDGARVVLTGGALAKNVFWQAAGGITLGTTAHGEGNYLSQTAITLATGATINGRLLAQTAVTMQSSTVIAVTP